MSYIAEIFVSDRELTARLKEMLAWLGAERSKPPRVHYVQRRNGMRVRVEFVVEDDAIAFARQFDGRVTG